MSNEWQIKIQWDINILGYALYFYRQSEYGKREFICQDGTTKVVKNGEMLTEPLWALRLESTEQLRQLIEEAERQGVKAPTTERITGELEATKVHLEDMRNLVFKRGRGAASPAHSKEQPQNHSK